MPSPYADDIMAIKLGVEALVEDCSEIKATVKEMNGRQRSDHDRITALETKLGIFGGAQAAFTAIAATVAAWFGANR